MTIIVIALVILCLCLIAYYEHKIHHIHGVNTLRRAVLDEEISKLTCENMKLRVRLVETNLTMNRIAVQAVGLWRNAK